MTTAGTARATREADDAVALAADLRWRTEVRPAGLDALDSTMRPVDRLGAAGLGELTRFVQPCQDVIDRLTGKAAAVRAFTDAWHRAATGMAEATADFAHTLRVDTGDWTGEAATAWRNRATEYLQAMRGSAAAAKATAAVATAMGETVAGARTEAARITDELVDAIINLAYASAAIQGNTTDLLVRVARLAAAREPAVGKAEDDLVTTIAQFRTSPAGRLRDLWQDLGVWFGALPRNVGRTTPPANGKGGVYLDGDYIHLVPRDPNVPRVRLPNNVGAEGFEVGPWWDVISHEHTYDVHTDTEIKFDEARDVVGDEIARNPVPGWDDSKGTPEGATNNAGFGNLVRTYTYPSPDPSRYTDITVNYTLGDKHILQEGYVIRYGERMPDGTTRIVSYGEGNGALQHPASPAHVAFWLAWEKNQCEIERAVEKRMDR